MFSRNVAAKGAAKGLEEILEAGRNLQEALDAEHILSTALRGARPEPGAYDRFHEARQQTQLALSAYNEAIRCCAEKLTEDRSHDLSRSGLWARLMGMGLAVWQPAARLRRGESGPTPEFR